jgi:hypothetical protein
MSNVEGGGKNTPEGAPDEPGEDAEDASSYIAVDGDLRDVDDHADESAEAESVADDTGTEGPTEGGSDESEAEATSGESSDLEAAARRPAAIPPPLPKRAQPSPARKGKTIAIAVAVVVVMAGLGAAVANFLVPGAPQPVAATPSPPASAADPSSAHPTDPARATDSESSSAVDTEETEGEQPAAPTEILIIEPVLIGTSPSRGEEGDSERTVRRDTAGETGADSREPRENPRGPSSP